MAIENGGPGADALNGTAGADTLTGAGGDDYYTVNDPGDLVVELPDEGVDSVEVSINNYVLPDNVENLGSSVSSYHYNYFGNSLGNYMHVIRGVVYGYGGNDEIYGSGTFYGGGGADWLRLEAYSNGISSRFYGGDDNDVITSDHAINQSGANCRFYGDAGNDTIQINIQLDYFDSIEIYGGADNDTINIDGFIQSGASLTIDGGSGADAVNLQNLSLFGSNNTISITGGSGDDAYTVDYAWTLTEIAGGGHDTVHSSVSFTLGAEFEDLVLTGASAIDGAGNGLANAITGNSAANILTGGGGADMMSGGGGNDRFRASGADLVSGESIDGGANFDTLEITGGGSVSLAGITLSNLEAIEVTDAAGTTLTLADASQSALIAAASGAADVVIMGPWDGDAVEVTRLIAAGVETIRWTDGPGTETTGWTGVAQALPGGGFSLEWTDTGGLSDWTRSTTLHDAAGFKLSRTVIYDNGTDLNLVYADGVAVSATQTDPLDATNWTRIDTAYGPGGVIATRHTVYDDGAELTLTYAGGVLASSTQTDPLNAANWTSIDTTYGPGGSIVSRHIVYDSGVELTQTYSGGQIAGATYVYPDGTTFSQTFAGGVLASSTQTDPLNAANWTSIDTTYGPGGVVTGRHYFFDNGTEQTQVYSGGALVSATQTDPLNAEGWTSVYTTYGPGGVVTGRHYLFDNGTELTQVYSGGVLVSATQTDPLNAANWTSIDTTYGPGGSVVSRHIAYDNGVDLTQTYSGGQIAGATYVYPDGTTVTQTFAGGVLASAVQTDPLDVAAWARIDTTYGAGNAPVLRAIEYDDGHLVVTGLAGAQTIEGGAHDDLLSGGAGIDRFVFAPGGGHDRVTDFADAQDWLDLSAFGIDSLAELQAAATLTDTAAGLLIAFATGESLTLTGFDLAHLDDTDLMPHAVPAHDPVFGGGLVG